jgi:hypothetical protein
VKYTFTITVDTDDIIAVKETIAMKLAGIPEIHSVSIPDIQQMEMEVNK